MAWRTSSGKSAAGLSSMSFWWRRWDEQSRSPSHRALPWVSAKTCISMWRGHVEVALEVDLGPAEVGLGLALGRLHRLGDLVGSDDTTFMPRPPPP